MQCKEANVVHKSNSSIKYSWACSPYLCASFVQEFWSPSIRGHWLGQERSNYNMRWIYPLMIIVHMPLLRIIYYPMGVSCLSLGSKRTPQEVSPSAKWTNWGSCDGIILCTWSSRCKLCQSKNIQHAYPIWIEASSSLVSDASNWSSFQVMWKDLL